MRPAERKRWRSRLLKIIEDRVRTLEDCTASSIEKFPGPLPSVRTWVATVPRWGRHGPIANRDAFEPRKRRFVQSRVERLQRLRGQLPGYPGGDWNRWIFQAPEGVEMRKLMDKLHEAFSAIPCKVAFVSREECDGQCGSKTPTCHDDACSHGDGECHSSHVIYRKAEPGEHQPHASGHYAFTATHVEMRCPFGCSVKILKKGLDFGPGAS